MLTPPSAAALFLIDPAPKIGRSSRRERRREQNYEKIAALNEFSLLSISSRIIVSTFQIQWSCHAP